MNALRGTIALTGLALRRDRLKLSAYVLGPAVLMAGMVAMWNADTHQALVEEIELFAGTPALRIFGVVSGVSIGSAFMTRGYLLLAVLAALMSALAVVRTPARTRRPAAPNWSARRSSGDTPAWPPRSLSRSAPTSCLPACWAWSGSGRAARGGFVHGRSRGRRLRDRVRRGRGGHRAALVDHAGSERSRRRGRSGSPSCSAASGTCSAPLTRAACGL